MMAARRIDSASIGDEDLRSMLEMMGTMFRDNAPMTAAEAATVILDGVRNEEWRILVGDDAQKLDKAVRADPLAAYDGLALSSLGDVFSR
jgi:hypothetical protein